MENHSKLIAFDRQNHMGATDRTALSITAAMQEEAENMLAERTLVSGAVTIQENADRMKVRHGSKGIDLLKQSGEEKWRQYEGGEGGSAEAVVQQKTSMV